MSSELSREEAALACALHAMGWHQHYTNCVEQAKVTIRNAPESIRSALSGGGGGEKATDGTFGDIVRPEWIDVPFETEPNRPILLASAAEHLRAYAVSQERCAAWNARERDALKAELAEAKKRITTAHDSVAVLIAERDAALARVKELEARVNIATYMMEQLTAKLNESSAEWEKMLGPWMKNGPGVKT